MTLGPLYGTERRLSAKPRHKGRQNFGSRESRRHGVEE